MSNKIRNFREFKALWGYDEEILEDQYETSMITIDLNSVVLWNEGDGNQVLVEIENAGTRYCLDISYKDFSKIMQDSRNEQIPMIVFNN
jgi:hypothetical protein